MLEKLKAGFPGGAPPGRSAVYRWQRGAPLLERAASTADPVAVPTPEAGR